MPAGDNSRAPTIVDQWRKSRAWSDQSHSRERYWCISATRAAGERRVPAREAARASRCGRPRAGVALNWRYARARGEAIEALHLALYLLCCLLVLGLRRLPPSYALYTSPQLLLIGTRTTFSPLMATARDVLVRFPTLAVLA